MGTHGRQSYVTVDGTDITSYCSAVGLSRGSGTSDASTVADTDKAFLAARENSTLTVGGVVDPAVVDVLSACFDGGSVAFVYGPTGSTGGMVKYSGSAVVTGFQVGVNVRQAVDWSASLQVTGVLTVGTF